MEIGVVDVANVRVAIVIVTVVVLGCDKRGMVCENEENESKPCF